MMWRKLLLFKQIDTAKLIISETPVKRDVDGTHKGLRFTAASAVWWFAFHRTHHPVDADYLPEEIMKCRTGVRMKPRHKGLQ
jgi:hypothetical protein